jgi:hypothetical protein
MLETKFVGSGLMASNRKRGQGSSWAVEPAEAMYHVQHICHVMNHPAFQAFRYSFVILFFCVLLPCVSIMIFSLGVQRRKRIKVAVLYFCHGVQLNNNWAASAARHEDKETTSDSMTAAADQCFPCNPIVCWGHLTNQSTLFNFLTPCPQCKNPLQNPINI